MTKEQLITIAKAGFPENVKQFIDFENVEMNHFGGVYRLYDKDTPFLLMLPEVVHLHIFIEGDFVQISPEHLAFNHYAAIKEMERLGLV